MYIIILISTIVSVLEGFGILMLLPLLESIGSLEKSTNEAGLGFNNFLYAIMDFFGLSHSTISVLLIIVLIFVLKGILTFVALTVNSYLIGSLLKNIKLD